jgi:hypothetical protein
MRSLYLRGESALKLQEGAEKTEDIRESSSSSLRGGDGGRSSSVLSADQLSVSKACGAVRDVLLAWRKIGNDECDGESVDVTDGGGSSCGECVGVHMRSDEGGGGMSCRGGDVRGEKVSSLDGDRDGRGKGGQRGGHGKPLKESGEPEGGSNGDEGARKCRRCGRA